MFSVFSLTRILICAVICPCTNFCSLRGRTLTNEVILLFDSIYLRAQMAVNAFLSKEAVFMRSVMHPIACGIDVHKRN